MTLNDLRRALIRTLNGSDISELEDTLKEIKNITKLGFTGFQDVKEITKGWPIGVSKSISGSDTMLVSKDDKKIVFVTRISPGGEFPIHWHDNRETCEVISGYMQDKKVKIKTLSKGSKCVYEPYVQHQPINPNSKIDCVILVTFEL